MPTITVINDTQVPLHISFRHISPLHYVNSVGPGATAEFEHVGRVWFTIEARIDRGDGNGYTKFESVAAPIAVSLTALSLGAGAIYIAGAASAAGGVSAAVTGISARIGATAAAHGPTMRRLYKYAKQGQKIVQIGNIVGIGGGAFLGKKAAENQAKEKVQHDGTSSELVEEGTKKSQWPTWNEHKRVKEAKKVLKGLLEGSVVSSPGWYMNKPRTIRIKGGPRATEVEGLLVIETDTLQPFEVVANDVVPEDGAVSSGHVPNIDESKKKGKQKEESDTEITAEEEDTVRQNDSATRARWYERLSESSKWLHSRIRRSPEDPLPKEESESESDGDDAGDTLINKKLGQTDPLRSTSSLAPPPDDDPHHPPSLETVLQEIGFTSEQIQKAVQHVGNGLTPRSDADQEVIEQAIVFLLEDEREKGNSAVDTKPGSAVVDVLEADTPETSRRDRKQSEDAIARPSKQVIGADSVTNPHWTTKAREKAERSGATKLLGLGGSHLVEKGGHWLKEEKSPSKK